MSCVGGCLSIWLAVTLSVIADEALLGARLITNWLHFNRSEKCQCLGFVYG